MVKMMQLPAETIRRCVLNPPRAATRHFVQQMVAVLDRAVTDG
jgi:hypothetical protein